MLKRHYGQVLCTNVKLGIKMCEMMNACSDSNIVEIGFGHLFITKIILRYKFASLQLFEIDHDIYMQHVEYLSKIKNVEVFNVDFVEWIKASKLQRKHNITIISNIAYNIFKITMTFIILYKYTNISRLIILIPSELANSLIKQESAFAKLVACFYTTTIKYVLDGKTCFSRPLNFNSSIVVIDRIKDSIIPGNIDLKEFYDFIKLLFNNKKKKLKHNSKVLVNEDLINIRVHQLTTLQIFELFMARCQS